MPNSEDDFTRKIELDIMLEEICQAWWRPHSVLQLAVRSLNSAAENSLKKMAALKLIKSFTDIKSPIYKSIFKFNINKFCFWNFFVVFLQKKFITKEKRPFKKKLKKIYLVK